MIAFRNRIRAAPLIRILFSEGIVLVMKVINEFMSRFR